MAFQMALVPAVLRYGTDVEVAAHVRRILSESEIADGFVLMAPTPNGSPAANVRAVVRVLAEAGFPLNRSEAYGNILDPR